LLPLKLRISGLTRLAAPLIMLPQSRPEVKGLARRNQPNVRSVTGPAGSRWRRPSPAEERTAAPPRPGRDALGDTVALGTSHAAAGRRCGVDV